MTNTHIAQVPHFPGFYESHLSGIIDNWQEREAYYLAETQDATLPQLAESHFNDAFYDAADYSDARRAIAEAYVAQLPFACEYESMHSPREYNFSTDRLFVTISSDTLRHLIQLAMPTLAETIRCNHTSCDGYTAYSDYSNDIADWPLDDIDRLDHNHIYTIIDAALSDDCDDIISALYDCDFEFSDCVDWPKFDECIKQARIEFITDTIESDIQSAVEQFANSPLLADALDQCNIATIEEFYAVIDGLEPATPRCPYTLQLPL
jgi:hypothetical protein